MSDAVSLSSKDNSLSGSNKRISYNHELKLSEQGFKYIAGIDEVGRGPLAGPVVAAAVILNPQKIPEGLNDSKKLSAKKREYLFNEILQTSQVGIASVSANEIDRINIRQASLLAMRRACLALPVFPDAALVDGRDAPDLSCPAFPIIKGDALVLSIAAASIIAKVTRDHMMKHLSIFFPKFFFEKNAGYGVAKHLEALNNNGATPYHRLSFSPLRQSKPSS